MTKWFLIIITAISFFIRTYNINYPPLLWDEASIGYNAYSIINTAHDEYGKLLPFVFKSFGDYKPGLYIYLATPFVAIFGLNTLAVRLPSIILGSLLPLLLYLFILKVSPKSKNLAIYSSLLLAINPWNIHFSRGGWETNILLFELLLASYLFINKKLVISAIIFGLTFYTYQGGKIMSPLLICILLYVYHTNYNIRTVLSKFFIPILIISIPIVYGLLTKNDSNRLTVFALWNYHRPTSEINQLQAESTNLNMSIFHNNVIFFIRNFIVRYFNSFSPRFLAYEGDWQVMRHGAPYIGMLLYPTFIFLIIGIFSSISRSITSINLFFLLWLLISPLPGALTRDIIQPVRNLSLSIPLIYFAAQGIFFTTNYFKKFQFSIHILLGLIYVISFIYYIDLYYNHMVKIRPSDWLYGYHQAFDYVNSHGNGKQITFSDFYGQPYIYYLFYSKYPPSKYQSQAQLTINGNDVGKVTQIDNLKFEVPNYSYLKTQPNQLLIFSIDDALRQGIDLKSLTPLSPINNISTFYAYETN